MAEFGDYLLELFAPLGPVQCRRMFSGWGLFLDGVMFALVVDNELYLKADAQSEPQFRQHGLPAFSYQRQGRAVALSYFLAPESLYEDESQARYWGELALAAAYRSAARKRRGR